MLGLTAPAACLAAPPYRLHGHLFVRPHVGVLLRAAPLLLHQLEPLGRDAAGPTGGGGRLLRPGGFARCLGLGARLLLLLLLLLPLAAAGLGGPAPARAAAAARAAARAGLGPSGAGLGPSGAVWDAVSVPVSAMHHLHD